MTRNREHRAQRDGERTLAVADATSNVVSSNLNQTVDVSAFRTVSLRPWLQHHAVRESGEQSANAPADEEISATMETLSRRLRGKLRRTCRSMGPRAATRGGGGRRR